MTDIVPGGRRYSSVPCPRGSDLPIIDVVALPEKYDRTELSYAEAALLTRAGLAADESLAEAHPRIQDAADRLAQAWHRAAAALQRLAEFEAEQALREAGRACRRVRDRHAGDGPEDRRHRPFWLRAPLVWTLIMVSAIYDTVFFATIFQNAIDLRDDAPLWEKAISYIPGFGIAMALILSGSMLAVPLFRHRARAERRRLRGRLDWRVVLSRTFLVWRRNADQRADQDLPWPSWPFPVAFVALVLAVLGVWAWLRGRSMFDPSMRWPLVALLLLLTVSAITFKAVAHNPFADRSAEASKQLRQARDRLAKLEIKARREIGAITTAGQKLQAANEEAAAAARRHVTQAWSDIADQRGRHGLTGPVAPGFAPVTKDDLVGCLMFAGLQAPALRVRVLDYGITAVDSYHAEQLEKQLDEVLKRLNDQLATALS
ncbi:hypothetical protein [Actinoplanes sp. TFC3]|uniref:hypothetical protein n=1 Tax=Actinoplanes sp. TFC3 TaxID=1710355 RepID=UPI0008355C8F|nr:hypothetical protein [Actinoplanes sp. TFC3]